jgi:hypothetical protein
MRELEQRAWQIPVRRKHNRLEVRRTNNKARLEASRTKMMTSRWMLSNITSSLPPARIKGTTFGMRQR